MLKKFEVIAYISNWAFFGCSQSCLCFLNMSWTFANCMNRERLKLFLCSISVDSSLCFRLTFIHSVSYFFFVYRSPLSLCTVFDPISSNIGKVLSVNPSAAAIAFGDLNIHHKDWLTYSGRTDRSGELCYNFFVMTLLRWLTFLPGSQAVILTVVLFWISFFLLMLVFVLQWGSLQWEILIMLLSQFALTFHHTNNGISHFIALLMNILMLIGTIFVIIWEMFYGRSLNSVLLLLLVHFASGFR